MVKLNTFMPFVALMAAHTVHTAPTTSAPTTSASQPPSSILPPGGSSTAPANSELVQIGFGQALNYNFVSGNPEAINEIFSLTPPGVAYDLDINSSAVVMQSLKPYDTQKTYGYTTTLALFYIPSTLVTTFQNDVTTPSSRLYHQPNASVENLMRQINPKISTTPS